MFQSTPPAEARGDRLAVWRELAIGVSIHSPRRSEGRPRAQEIHPKSLNSFNPLPPPKRGETIAHPGPLHQFVVSIHSPRRSEGRLLDMLYPSGYVE